MAANISQHADGSYQCFTAGAPAWHYLGTNVKKAQSWRKAYELSKMVSIHIEQLKDSRSNEIPVWGLFRDDNNSFIHQCGKNYGIIQAEDAFQFLDTLIDTGNGCHYTSAGTLQNGKMIWCNLEIPETIRIRNTDDIMNCNLFFVDYRNGKQATAHTSITRPVCQNTITTALRENGLLLKFRHDKQVQDRLNSAKEIIVREGAELKSLEEKFNILARKKATNNVIQNVINKLIPNLRKSERAKNKARDILERYEINDNDVFPSERGTAFNLLNAITGYVDHESTVKIGKYDVDVSDIENSSQQMHLVKRAESSIFGAGNVFKTNALEYIFEAVKNEPTISEKKIFQTSKIESILSKVNTSKVESILSKVNI